MKLSRKNSVRALTLAELLVVIAVIAVLAAIFLPALLPARRRGGRVNCVNSLKQVGIAFKIWAGDNAEKYPMQVLAANGGAMELAASGNVFSIFQVMSNELNTPKVLICPEETQRKAATNFTTDLNDSKISYFVALDANKSNPQMLLSGDRNLTTNRVAVRSGILKLNTNDVVGWTKELHKFQGNVLVVDGSVYQFSTGRLRDGLQHSGVSTNRLLMP